MNNLKLIMSAGAASLSLAWAGAAAADDQPAPATPPPAAATPAAAPAATPPAPTAPGYPSMGPTLANNVNSATFDAGPIGKLTVNGVFSGVAYAQDNPGFDLDGHLNKTAAADFTNAMVVIQKQNGVFQFVVQAGAYSFPTVGTAYTKISRTTTDLFGVVPVGYAKLVPNSWFNIEVGVLPTLIGAELPFTYQNMNIERGLLWNQEPIVSRGVQANVTKGPWALALSVNDGWYSGEWTTISGSITYTFKNSDTLVVDGSGNTSDNFKHCSFSCFSPFAGGTGGPIGFTVPTGGQSQGQIYNLIFNHTMGKWAITPYVQYSYIPNNILGFLHLPSGSSYGGAILAKYSFTPEISVAGRAEYIGSSGHANLLYGPGSNAWSVTVTPTYQKGIFFARIEASYVGVGSGTRGSLLGKNLDKKEQVRGFLEGGVIF